MDYGQRGQSRLQEHASKSVDSPNFSDIPRSGQNPKSLGEIDTEVIRPMIAIGVPFSGHLLAQEGEDRRFEIGECGVTSIVGDMFVHQAP
jgi:hypothetical protein